MLTALLIVILLVLVYFVARGVGGTRTPSEHMAYVAAAAAFAGSYMVFGPDVFVPKRAATGYGERYTFGANPPPGHAENMMRIRYNAAERQIKAGDTLIEGGAIPISAIIRGTIKQAANLTHLSLSTGATFASLGMGGDTIVDCAFLAIGAAELTARLGIFLASDMQFIKDILASGFEGGPDAVAARSATLLRAMPEASRDNLFALIRSGMQTLLEVAGTVLSALIPDDGGAFAVGASWLGSIGGAIGTPQWFSGLRAIYNLIPEALRSYVESANKLEELFGGILDSVDDIITSANVGIYQSALRAARGASWKRIALSALVPSTMAPQIGLTVAAQFGPTREFMRGRIREARNHTELATDLVQHALGLLFAAAYVLQMDTALVPDAQSRPVTATLPPSQDYIDTQATAPATQPELTSVIAAQT